MCCTILIKSDCPLLGVSKQKRTRYAQYCTLLRPCGTHYLILQHLLLFIFQLDCLVLLFTNKAWLKYKLQIDSQNIMEDCFEGKSGHVLGIFGLWNPQFVKWKLLVWKVAKLFFNYKRKNHATCKKKHHGTLQSISCALFFSQSVVRTSKKFNRINET